MRTPKQWLARRRAIRENRAASDEITRQALLDQHRDILKEQTKAVCASLEAIGFKTPERYASDPEFTVSTLVALSPDGHAHRLSVFRRGGYRMESI